MRRSRFTEEQIIGVLQEAEAGAGVQELCRRYGFEVETAGHPGTLTDVRRPRSPARLGTLRVAATFTDTPGADYHR